MTSRLARNDAADAWWCVWALDWNNEQVRREVIKALIPSVERAAKHTTDKRVHDCIGALKDWFDGKPADLDAAAWAARAAEGAELEAQRADLIAAFPPLILKD